MYREFQSKYRYREIEREKKLIRRLSDSIALWFGSCDGRVQQPTRVHCNKAREVRPALRSIPDCVLCLLRTWWTALTVADNKRLRRAIAFKTLFNNINHRRRQYCFYIINQYDSNLLPAAGAAVPVNGPHGDDQRLTSTSIYGCDCMQLLESFCLKLKILELIAS